MNPWQKDGDVADFIPNKGRGSRCLDCDHYEGCLHLAAFEDWEGFNCENCTYTNRGLLNFHCEEFPDLPLFEEFEGLDGLFDGFGCTLLSLLEAQGS